MKLLHSGLVHCIMHMCSTVIKWLPTEPRAFPRWPFWECYHKRQQCPHWTAQHLLEQQFHLHRSKGTHSGAVGVRSFKSSFLCEAFQSFLPPHWIKHGCFWSSCTSVLVDCALKHASHTLVHWLNEGSGVDRQWGYFHKDREWNHDAWGHCLLVVKF